MKKDIKIPDTVTYRISPYDRELLTGLIKTRKPKNMSALIRAGFEHMYDMDQLGSMEAIRKHLKETVGEPTPFQILRFAFQSAERELARQTKQ
jgi:Arc/MetJ-type ribon-helix-helix transcriptional regulator